MKGNLFGPNSTIEQVQTKFDLESLEPQNYKLNQNYFTKDELMEQANFHFEK